MRYALYILTFALSVNALVYAQPGKYEQETLQVLGSITFGQDIKAFMQQRPNAKSSRMNRNLDITAKKFSLEEMFRDKKSRPGSTPLRMLKYTFLDQKLSGIHCTWSTSQNDPDKSILLNHLQKKYTSHPTRHVFLLGKSPARSFPLLNIKQGDVHVFMVWSKEAKPTPSTKDFLLIQLSIFVDSELHPFKDIELISESKDPELIEDAFENYAIIVPEKVKTKTIRNSAQ